MPGIYISHYKVAVFKRARETGCTPEESALVVQESLERIAV